jgi:predicted MFS family arabinose efflux permease
MAFGGALMALAIVPSFLWALVVMIFVGGLASAFQSLNNALTMSATDRAYHGRVQAISMLSWSLFSLMALPLGFLADAIGLRQTMVIMGGSVVLCVAAIEAIGRITHVSDQRSGETQAPQPEATPIESGIPVGGGR